MDSVNSMKRLSDRTFGLTLAVVLLVIAGVGWLLFDAVLVWPPVAAALFLVIALTVPWLLLPLNRLWHAFAYRLGHVTNYLLLGLYFFLFIVPFGFALRVFGWDPLCRVQNPKTETYWTRVQRHTTSDTLHDMF